MNTSTIIMSILIHKVYLSRQIKAGDTTAADRLFALETALKVMVLPVSTNYKQGGFNHA